MSSAQVVLLAGFALSIVGTCALQSEDSAPHHRISSLSLRRLHDAVSKLSAEHKESADADALRARGIRPALDAPSLPKVPPRLSNVQSSLWTAPPRFPGLEEPISQPAPAALLPTPPTAQVHGSSLMKAYAGSYDREMQKIQHEEEQAMALEAHRQEKAAAKAKRSKGSHVTVSLPSRKARTAAPPAKQKPSPAPLSKEQVHLAISHFDDAFSTQVTSANSENDGKRIQREVLAKQQLASPPVVTASEADSKVATPPEQFDLTTAYRARLQEYLPGRPAPPVEHRSRSGLYSLYRDHLRQREAESHNVMERQVPSTFREQIVPAPLAYDAPRMGGSFARQLSQVHGRLWDAVPKQRGDPSGSLLARAEARRHR